MNKIRFFSRLDMQRIFLEALILGVLAVAVGLSLNFKMVFNAFSGQAVANPVKVADTRIETQESVVDAFPMPVVFDELDDFLSQGAVLIDARNRKAYAEGHLQNAISLPLGEFDQEIATFKNEIPFDRTLITYCSGFGCPDSFDLGVLLLKQGYRDVLVYEGGFPEWRDSGRPIAKGAD